MKTLVLAEKPSVAKEIARVLGCKQSHKSYVEGPRHIVTWALGHLVTLAEPEDYDSKYKTWNLDDLPIIPERMKLKIIRESAHQFRAIEQLCRRPDLGELVIATDAGREGELVARWIMELVRWKKPFKRLWISSQTDKAIRDGFNNLRPGREFDRLYQSAVCRSEADWLIGLNVTRALTSKFNAQLAAGRVQTPTLAMLIEREREIRAFRPVEYWTVQANFGTFHGTWRDPQTNDARLFDRERAASLEQKLRGGRGKVVRVKRSRKQIPQPLAYDLTELQRDANRRFGFSAKQTLNVLQRLYEQHKLVTYPRTDSRYLTSDMVPTLTGRLKAVAVGPYAPLAAPLVKQPLKVTKRIVDDSQVSDHHAIIPTEQPPLLQTLSADERKLYDLIVRRFIALFYPPCEYDETKVTVEVQGEMLHAAGTVMRQPGWKEVYGSADMTEQDGNDEDGEREEIQRLPELKEGDALIVESAAARSQYTKPPSRYTEASLLSQMEKHNLGTPATRADIIEKLLSTDTIERSGPHLIPTGKGRQLIELVSEELRSPELTAEWERELERIARGTGSTERFLAGIRRKTVELVQEIKQSTAEYKPHNLTGSRCPDCGEFLQEIKGKRGKMLVCRNRECGYRRAAEPALSNRRCPQCRKRMEIRTGKAGKFVQCRACNVIEMLDGQSDRKEARSTRSLLKQYSDNKPLTSSLGEALRAALEQQNKK
jgi:DNA topoisomerase-3